MAQITVEVEGFNIFEKKLLRLETKASKKIVRKAVKDTGKAVQKTMKINARSDAFVGGTMGKLIAKHIIVRNQKRQRRGSFAVNVFIDPRANDQFVHITKTGKRHYIPAAIEFGHDNVRELPFMRDAWERNKSKLLTVLLQSIKDQLLKEAAR